MATFQSKPIENGEPLVKCEDVLAVLLQIVYAYREGNLFLQDPGKQVGKRLIILKPINICKLLFPLDVFQLEHISFLRNLFHKST